MRPTPQRTKTILNIWKLTTLVNKTTISAITLGRSTNNKLRHLFFPLSPSSGHEKSVFFGPVTPSRITTSETSILSQAKSLTVRSSLKYFPGHQRMATNSMHLHFSYILYLQRLSNCKRIWTQCSVCSGAFLWKQSMSYGCWLVWWIALSWLFGRILNTVLPNNLL